MPESLSGSVVWWLGFYGWVFSVYAWGCSL